MYNIEFTTDMGARYACNRHKAICKLEDLRIVGYGETPDKALKCLLLNLKAFNDKFKRFIDNMEEGEFNIIDAVSKNDISQFPIGDDQYCTKEQAIESFKSIMQGTWNDIVGEHVVLREMLGMKTRADGIVKEYFQHSGMVRICVKNMNFIKEYAELKKHTITPDVTEMYLTVNYADIASSDSGLI